MSRTTVQFLALLGLILFCIGLSSVEAKDCPFNPEKHKIACHIFKNKPNINLDYAMKLSNFIYKAAKKYDVNPFLLSALYMQESGYRLTAIGSYVGLRKPSKSEIVDLVMKCTDNLTEKEYQDRVVNGNNEQCINEAKNTLIKDRIIMDVGISQIFFKTAERYGFDLDKLTTDLEYSVMAGAQVLSDFKKKYGKKELLWWSRYNASSPAKRKIYQALVERYL